MVTDRETTAFERKVYYLQFPREEGMPDHAGPLREAPGWSGGRRTQRKAWPVLILWSPGKKWERQVGKFRIG